ncbi:MAG: U32 family peptidase [Chloroflexi bacterium]|nr:U32 family peptidase [Chloroflexota bacterium]
MKLMVGAKGNIESTKVLLEETRGMIAELFVSVQNSKYSSGRTYVHEIGFEELCELVKLALPYGVDIMAAFNTPCFGGKEVLPEFRREFDEYLERVYEAGVRKIVLTHPMLIRRAVEKFPDIDVVVSVFAEVDDLDKLKYYESLGARRVTIPHELNRDLPKLELFVKNSSMDMEVILNLSCVHYCARADFHCMFVGHCTEDMIGRQAGDYYTGWCDRFRVNRPWEILCGDWIRPEDIKRYEDIGIEYFKIAGRATSTTWIIRAVKAFASRRWEGNVFELLTQFYPYTDRLGDKSPLYLYNPLLDDCMDRLYSCGHICHQCDYCHQLYYRLAGKEKTGIFPGQVLP